VLKGNVTSSPARPKTVQLQASLGISRSDHSVATILVNLSSVASNPHGVPPAANDGSFRAWLRAQKEAAEMATVENCVERLDVYA
jgi:hypothetical protein